MWHFRKNQSLLSAPVPARDELGSFTVPSISSVPRLLVPPGQSFGDHGSLGDSVSVNPMLTPIKFLFDWGECWL